MPHCGTCAFWKPAPDVVDGCGLCKWNPPVVIDITDDGGVISAYPITERMDEACGRYRPHGEH